MRNPRSLKLMMALAAIASGAGADAAFAADKLKAPGKRVPLVKRILRQPKPVAPVSPESIPGMAEAAARLTRPVCAAAVGGTYKEWVEARLFTASYFQFGLVTMSAERASDGTIEFVYALSYVEARRVLLFPAFLRPRKVLTKLAAGGAESIDSIPNFETSHGFKKGSVTVVIVQALLILHEHSHLNGTGIDDLDCPALSMLNTRYIAEACFPEIIDNSPSIFGGQPSMKDTFAKVSASRSGGCNLCHSDQRVFHKVNDLPAEPN